jgi:Ca2+-binding RTX toxin-like protein
MSLGTIVSEFFSTSSNPYANGISNWIRWNTTAVTGSNSIVRFTWDSNWTAGQRNVVSIALNQWARFSNLSFVESVGGTQAEREANAEIIIHRTLGANIGGWGGYSGTPGEAFSYTTTTAENGVTFQVGDIGQVHTYIASDGNLNGVDCFDSNGNMTSAGFELTMHEFGHALGLKHPHDYGSSGNPVIFPGVTLGDSSDLGDNSLNQQLYTIMSYNPVQGLGGGECSTPMAFDIAAIQYMYGARLGVNTENNSYFLTDPNNATTWNCIWDTGGIDQIIYLGGSDAVIDLRPATLDNSPTGGGVPSYTQSGTNFGHGYTIAGDLTNAIADQNGVTGVIIENASGGNGNDKLTGNDVSNVLDGSNGNDIIDGKNGNDTIYGGNGNDTVDGGNGNDRIFLGEGNDHLNIISLGNDTFYGGNGDDYIFGYTNGEFYYGESGNDTLLGHSGNDLIDGGIGADSLDGGSGNDTLYYANSSAGVNVNLASNTANGGDATGDTILNFENLTGSNYGDILIGNSNNNTIIAGAGGDVVDGANGNDSLYGGAGNDTAYGGNGSDFLSGGIGNDLLYGEAGNDSLSGGTGNDTAYGGNGNDSLYGEADNDVLYGEADNDVLYGEAGNDSLYGGAGNDSLYGEAGNDYLHGGSSSDYMEGGLGNDTLVVDNVGDLVVEVSLLGGGTDRVQSSIDYTLPDYVENLTLLGTANLRGTGNNLNNLLQGNNGNNILYGLAGNDTLNGAAGKDYLFSGEGNDSLTGGLGNDVLLGEGGNDTLNGSDGDDYFYGGAGNNILDGGAGSDVLSVGVDLNFTLTNTQLIGEGTDTLISIEGAYLHGGSGNNTIDTTGFTTGNVALYGEAGDDRLSAGALQDYLYGQDGADTLDGSAGNDYLFGGEGNDSLTGGLGNDVLLGEGGNDTLIGGQGVDNLIGGDGSDLFSFAAPTEGMDIITDFATSIDKIGINAAGFGGGLVAGTIDASQFVLGTAALDGGDRVIYNQSTGTLFFDADGAGANAQVQFATLTTNPAIDFNDIVVI